MGDSFSAELWQSTADIYAAILAHPFVSGLTDGSLPQEAFTFYVVQDALYLKWYAQALAAVASRAPDTAGTEMFARHAAGIVEVEMSLHASLLADLDIDATAVAASRRGADDACLHELPAGGGARRLLRGGSRRRAAVLLDLLGGRQAPARSRLAESALPEVDRHLRGRGVGAEALEVIAVADRLGPGLGATERDLVRRHFRATSRYEWLFWDMGYRQETWPV